MGQFEAQMFYPSYRKWTNVTHNTQIYPAWRCVGSLVKVAMTVAAR